MNTFNSMVEFLDSAYPAKQFVVPCLLGPAGIGKTAAVLKHAENVGASKVVTIIASQILPNEVSGITMPVPERHAMEIFDHYRLSSLQDGDILFFDELLEADQMVLSACLTLIESRQLMSGHKLPDVQIIAATNPTIKPNMLRENIRQRFVFREFALDQQGCRDYIKKIYGFDPGESVSAKLATTGGEYNILTPRSLTKMCGWLASAGLDKAKAKAIAKQIDMVWKTRLGSELLNPYLESIKGKSREAEMREALHDACSNAGIEGDFDFDNCSIPELVEVLQSLPEWKQVEDYLSAMVVEDDDTDKIEF